MVQPDLIPLYSSITGTYLKRSAVTTSTLACGGVGEASRHSTPGTLVQREQEPLPGRGLCSRVFRMACDMEVRVVCVYDLSRANEEEWVAGRRESLVQTR
jgi:hypothetical protein